MPGPSGAPARERWWTLARLALGTGQMAGATAALILLVQTGVNARSLGAVVVTCALTTTSVLLFGSRRPR